MQVKVYTVIKEMSLKTETLNNSSFLSRFFNETFLLWIIKECEIEFKDCNFDTSFYTYAMHAFVFFIKSDKLSVFISMFSGDQSGDLFCNATLFHSSHRNTILVIHVKQELRMHKSYFRDKFSKSLVNRICEIKHLCYDYCQLGFTRFLSVCSITSSFRFLWSHSNS